VEDVVTTAIQEDCARHRDDELPRRHNEYFKYMFDLLKEKGAGHIKVFGGGGGTILRKDQELQAYGITRSSSR